MRFVHCSLAGLALLCFVPEASASILTFTYQGTVSYGSDTTGAFGAVNTDLSGKDFTAVLSFDTAKFKYTNTDGSSFSYQMGGSSYGAAFAGALATISIGGSAPRSIVDVKDSVQNTTGVNTASIENSHSFINADNENDFYEESLQFSTYSPSITYDYTKAFSVTSTTALPAGDAAFSGTYNLSAYVKNFSTGEFSSFDYAFANLQPSSLTVTNAISAVPLPASLPMFGGALLALAGLGVGLSRRTAPKQDAKASV